MILESNILELLIERDTLKINGFDNHKEPDKNVNYTLEIHRNVILVDEPALISKEVEECSGSANKQKNSFSQKGKNNLQIFFNSY